MEVGSSVDGGLSTESLKLVSGVWVAGRSSEAPEQGSGVWKGDRLWIFGVSLLKV